MTIGSTIKKLRRERDITQEQLAEYLNISASAISQWETDRVMPDITQLPILANIFDVSTDVILGVDNKRKEEKIKEIIKRSNEIKSSGEFQKAADFLQEQLSLYPNSYAIMSRLASAMLNSWIRKMGTEDPCEIVSLCQKVLAECTDDEIRGKASFTLSSTYRYLKKNDEVIKLAESRPHVNHTKEDILFWFMKGEEGIKQKKNYMSFCLTRIIVGLNDLALSKNEKGEFLYSAEDRVKLFEQMIGILELLFCDGDYFYKAQFGDIACAELSSYYFSIGDIDKAFLYLEKECDFLVHFDTYEPRTPHTSPAFRGIEDGGYIPEGGKNRTADTLEKILADEELKGFRDDPRYIRVIERLKEHAVYYKN